EDLAGLYLGRFPCRAEDTQPRGLEDVDDAAAQRVFGADHRQVDLLFLGEAKKGIEVVGLDGYVGAVRGGAGVAGSAEHALDAWRLGQFPNEGVLAPPLAD